MDITHSPSVSSTHPVDNVVPEILSCPSDLVSEVPVEASGSSVTWTSPVVTDNSGLAPTVTSSSIPGSFFLRGTTQVTYTFTDNSGNQVSCSFSVTVIAGEYYGCKLQ